MADATPSIDDEHIANHRRRVLAVVVFLGLLFGLEAGIESGVGPSSITAQKGDLNTSITAVTTAQSVAELMKIVGSIFVAVFTTSAAVQSRLVAGGAVAFCLGCVLIAAASSIVVLGAGFLLLGIGYSFLTVLVAPILEAYIVTRGDRHRISLQLSYAYTGSGVGVCLAYVLAGSNPDAWRMNYVIPAVMLALAIAGFIFVDRRAAASLRDLPAQCWDALCPKPQPAATPSPAGEKTRMPLWRVWLHTTLLMRVPSFSWTVASQTAMMFYLTSFVILTPTYIEQGLRQPKSTVAIVMGCTVPATIVGMVAGGYVVKHYRLDLAGQLKLCAVTSVASTPLAIGFLLGDSVVLFALALVCGMLVVFMNAAPSRTLLPLVIDSSGVVSMLHAAVDARTATDRDGDGEMGSPSGESAPSTSSHAQMDTVEQRNVVAREVLVAHANAVTNFVCRLCGSLPGPIVLASLLDSGMSMSAAFALIGFVGTVTSSLCAWIALRQCPPQPPSLVAANV